MTLDTAVVIKFPRCAEMVAEHVLDMNLTGQWVVTLAWTRLVSEWLPWLALRRGWHVLRFGWLQLVAAKEDWLKEQEVAITEAVEAQKLKSSAEVDERLCADLEKGQTTEPTALSGDVTKHSSAIKCYVAGKNDTKNVNLIVADTIYMVVK